MKKIEQTIDSREVAEMIGKEHNKLMRDIRNYIAQLGESKIGHTDFFTESTYKSSQNKEMPCYQVTKKGCEFIAHKLTGVKGTEFTARYITRFHEMEAIIQHEKSSYSFEELSPELQAIFMHDKKIQAVECRVNKLEDNMIIDYSQQQVLKNEVNKTVVTVLGGKEAQAYKRIGKKVFSECNHDIQDRFSVNSRNNIPRIRFKEAVEYIKSWNPSVNTMLLIQENNLERSEV